VCEKITRSAQEKTKGGAGMGGGERTTEPKNPCGKNAEDNPVTVRQERGTHAGGAKSLKGGQVCTGNPKKSFLGAGEEGKGIAVSDH